MTYSDPTTGGTPRTPKTPEHWNALASVIAAAVSALTFLLGFVGLPAAGVDSPAATSETVKTTVTVTATATPKEPEPDDPSGGQSNPSGSPGERWSGSLLFPSGTAYDLDLTPPIKEGGSSDLALYEINEGREANFYEASMALIQ
ncbi:hypothetical protein RB200_34000 [Streptomyces sp. PmtG]